MTPDQKATFDCLEMVINESRQDGLLDTIRLAFREHKEEMMRAEKPRPWHQRLFKRFVQNPHLRRARRP